MGNVVPSTSEVPPVRRQLILPPYQATKSRFTLRDLYERARASGNSMADELDRYCKTDEPIPAFATEEISAADLPSSGSPGGTSTSTSISEGDSTNDRGSIDLISRTLSSENLLVSIREAFKGIRDSCTLSYELPCTRRTSHTSDDQTNSPTLHHFSNGAES